MRCASRACVLPPACTRVYLYTSRLSIHLQWRQSEWWETLLQMRFCLTGYTALYRALNVLVSKVLICTARTNCQRSLLPGGAQETETPGRARQAWHQRRFQAPPRQCPQPYGLRRYQLPDPEQDPQWCPSLLTAVTWLRVIFVCFPDWRESWRESTGSRWRTSKLTLQDSWEAFQSRSSRVHSRPGRIVSASVLMQEETILKIFNHLYQSRQ